MPDDDARGSCSISESREKMRAKMAGQKQDRRTREQKLSKVIDGRSLRSTDRTEVFSFRASSELKAACKKAAKKSNAPLAEWMERALSEAIKREFNGAGH